MLDLYCTSEKWSENIYIILYCIDCVCIIFFKEAEIRLLFKMFNNLSTMLNSLDNIAQSNLQQGLQNVLIYMLLSREVFILIQQLHVIRA